VAAGYQAEIFERSEFQQVVRKIYKISDGLNRQSRADGPRKNAYSDPGAKALDLNYQKLTVKKKDAESIEQAKCH
jgi:hypothetical protein